MFLIQSILEAPKTNVSGCWEHAAKASAILNLYAIDRRGSGGGVTAESFLFNGPEVSGEPGNLQRLATDLDFYDTFMTLTFSTESDFV